MGPWNIKVENHDFMLQVSEDNRRNNKLISKSWQAYVPFFCIFIYTSRFKYNNLKHNLDHFGNTELSFYKSISEQ